MSGEVQVRDDDWERRVAQLWQGVDAGVEARAVLALTYVAQGRAREAAGLLLGTLAPRLTRYKRSMAGNAAELVGRAWN